MTRFAHVSYEKGEHFDTKVQKADDDVADIMKQIIDQAPKGEDVIIGIFDQPFETSEKIMRLGEVRAFGIEYYPAPKTKCTQVYGGQLGRRRHPTIL